MRHGPRTHQRPSLGARGHSPLIVGQQDTGLETKIEHVTLSGESHHDSQPSEFFNAPATSSFIYPISTDRSLGCHGQYFTESSLSPPEDYMTAFTPRSSETSSPWSSTNSPYSECTLSSPNWMHYAPGTIGQERGVQAFSQPRSGPSLHQQRSMGKLSGRQNHENSSGHHNVVDVERIRLGIDVRTTVMGKFFILLFHSS